MNEEITTQSLGIEYKDPNYLFQIIKFSNKFFRRDNSGLQIKKFSSENYHEIYSAIEQASKGESYSAYILLSICDVPYLLYGGMAHSKLLEKEDLVKYKQKGYDINFLGAGELKYFQGLLIANDRSGNFADLMKNFSAEQKETQKNLLLEIAATFYPFSISKDHTKVLTFGVSERRLKECLDFYEEDVQNSIKAKAFYKHDQTASSETLNANSYRPFVTSLALSSKTEKLYPEQQEVNVLTRRVSPNKAIPQKIDRETENKIHGLQENRSWVEFCFPFCFSGVPISPEYNI